MRNQKEKLLSWIEEDRDKLIKFLSQFIQAKSPNPPGNTKEASAFVCKFLTNNKLPYKIIAPQPKMPNIVGSFECSRPGRHLVLNGHMDVFPVGNQKWTCDPWGGDVINGRIYGRGACDMKCGTTASIFTFFYLNRIRNQLKGRLTLTVVSDEETLGPWGAKYLIKNHSEVLGDCCLNGEPSSPYTIQFGEKGLLWLNFTVQTPGCHGAYTHLSGSATKIACKLAGELEALTKIKVSSPEGLVIALREGRGTMEKSFGKGAGEVLQNVTLNIGTIHGGSKINMVPGCCIIEVDVRLPVGVGKEQIMSKLKKIMARYQQASFEEINYVPQSWCDPNGEILEYLRSNVKALKGFEPIPTISIVATDARLWRYRNIPAYVYGPSPTGMGTFDENVQINEFLHVVRTHVLSAYDYLS